MRRLWLLVLLAPAVAAAAPPQPVVGSGQITWETIFHTDTDGYINLAECASGSITLSWSPKSISSVTTSDLTVTNYQLYASNQQPGDICFTESDDSSNLVAGPVGAVINSTDTLLTSTFDTSVIATVAGKACSGTGNDDVFLCMQARNASNTAIRVANINNTDGGPAKLVLSRDRPPAAVNLSATPGEQAANVSWSSGGTASDSFRVDATPIGTTAVPSRSSPRIEATSYRLGGLVNDQPYTIAVTAFSVAGNPNPDPSPTTSVTPSHVLDFFTEYKDGGGREQGGCAGGPAGPAALVATAAALLAIRRRRR